MRFRNAALEPDIAAARICPTVIQEGKETSRVANDPIGSFRDAGAIRAFQKPANFVVSLYLGDQQRGVLASVIANENTCNRCERKRFR